MNNFITGLLAAILSLSLCLIITYGFLGVVCLFQAWYHLSFEATKVIFNLLFWHPEARVIWSVFVLGFSTIFTGAFMYDLVKDFKLTERLYEHLNIKV
jgi:hypothetical protein